MASTLTTAAGILKRVYGDFVTREQNLKHRAIDEIAKSAKKYNAGGEGFFGSINVYGNEAVGSINETESFRSADNENYQQIKIIPKINVGPVQFSGLLSKAADSDEEAFATAVVDLLDNTKERLLKEMNRQFFGLGNGSMATASTTAVTSATTLTVSNAQYLRDNMVVDIINSGTTQGLAVRLTAVNKATGACTVAALATQISSGATIYKQNTQVSAPSDGKDCMGLRGIVDDGTDLSSFEGLTVASFPNAWQSIRIDAGAANLTSDLLQRVADDVQILSGEMIDLYIMHPKQRRKYLDIVVPQKRYMDQSLDGGFKKLEFNGVELWLDPDCQNDTVYALKKAAIEKFEVAPLSLGNYDGSDNFLRLSGQDVFEAYWRVYMNFGTEGRNRMGKIVNLLSPSGIN